MKLALAAAMGVLLLVGMSASAWALPLVDENFSYAVGSALVGQGGWAQTGTTTTNPILITTPGLTYAGYPGSGIGEAITLMTSGQDANKLFTGITGGSAYAAMLVNLNPVATAASGDYFFHFFDGAVSSNTFRGRLFVKKDSLAPNNYAFGIQVGSAASAVYTGYLYAPGTTHLLVVKYEYVAGTTNDICSLFVDPVISMVEPLLPTLTTTDASQADATNLDAIGVRQGGASTASTPQIDGIRVGSDWGDVVAGSAVDPTGACCDTATGACTITTEANCTFSWLGADVPCNPTTCPNPDPLGACCNGATAACTMTTASACAAPSVWHGEWASCTPNPCPALQVSLCDVAADDPVTMRPVLEGALVHVTALALVDQYQWQTTNMDFEVTDGGCCVSIFAGGTSWPTVLAGDMLDVVGTVGFYNGKTEITTPGLTIAVQSSGNPLPAPTQITTFELAANGEPYDDCFIKIRCVQIVGGDAWPIAGSNANIQVDDGSGITVLRIDKETDIDGSPAPVGSFTVIGLGTQFDTTAPFSDSYQILPRSLADLVYDCTVTGACCFLDGHCEVLSEAECTAAPDNVQWVAGATCTPGDTPCAQPGACCDLATGACTFVLEQICVAPMVFHADLACTPLNPCAQPGACCDPDTGFCTFVLQENCPQGWTWMTGVACAPSNPCPPPVATGVCCDPQGLCTITTQVNCTAPSMWHPEWTSCEPNYCPPPVPTERTTWGKIKSDYR